jgi:hypothetical protein
VVLAARSFNSHKELNGLCALLSGNIYYQHEAALDVKITEILRVVDAIQEPVRG